MEQEIQTPQVDETKPTETKTEEVKEPEWSQLELEVMDQGWVPKEQWVEAGNSPDDWRSAKEFKERGELFSKIHQLNRETRSQQAALDSMKRHHQFVFEQAHKRALADLKKERRMAMRDEDMDRVEAIEEEMETLNESHEKQREQFQVQSSPAQAAPELAAFIGRNQWYETDPELRDEADAVGLVFANRNPGSTPASVLKHVEDTIKKRHPEKFAPKKAAPNAVAAVDRTRSSRKAESGYQLDEMETKIMNDLVRAGVMTKEEYIADLKKAKGE